MGSEYTPMYSEEVKAKARELDPECWKSYSGQPRNIKRVIDYKRLDSLNEALSIISNQVIEGAREMTVDVESVLRNAKERASFNKVGLDGTTFIYEGQEVILTGEDLEFYKTTGLSTVDIALDIFDLRP